MSLKSLAIAAGCAALIAGPASAITTGTVGGQIIAAPTLVTDAVVFNTIIQGFDERQNVLLGSALAVDGGSIAAGTRVSSHMIFLNKQNGVSGSLAFGLAGTPAVQFSFDGAILGVMSDITGNLEATSNPILGAIGSTYQSPFSNRGMEGNNVNTKNDDWYSFSGNTISLGMYVTQPGDWIRVVTAAPDGQIPVPAAGLLLPAGFAVMALSRRRRRRKAT